MCVYIYIYYIYRLVSTSHVYKWHARPGSYTAHWEHISIFECTYIYMYIYCEYIIYISYCLLPIDIDLFLGIASWCLLHAPELHFGAVDDEEHETWSRDVVVFTKVFFWKCALSQLQCKSSESADTIDWLRDQPFEQGMTIYVYIERERHRERKNFSSSVMKRLGFMRLSHNK